MANGRFLIGKSSGGVTTVTSVDGANNTTLVLPESGVLATEQYVDSTKAPLNSPALTGEPTATTAAVGNNSTRIATTAFVIANRDAITATTVGAATAGIGVGAVGSYAFLENISYQSAIIAGTSYGGSGLRYAGLQAGGTGTAASLGSSAVGGAPSGTWKAMGTCGTSTAYAITLFLRIA